MNSHKLFAERYKFLSSLGKGGMGEVYLVEDVVLNEKVALKLIKKEATLNPAYVEKFIYEVKLARKISHQNVVRTFDLGWFDGNLYYTMEYVNGDSLKKFLCKVKSLPLNLILKFIAQLADGLSEIHKAGVVHRDLKPANVILTENLDCKIADFGIANLLTGDEIQLEQKVYGSFGYIAPEIWSGKKPDHKSDLYSLGVIAYELLSGQCPFESENTQHALDKHLNYSPPNLSSINPAVPEQLSSLVMSLLQKNPDLRPASAEMIVKSVTAIQESIKQQESTVIELIPIASRASNHDEATKIRKRGLKGLMQAPGDRTLVMKRGIKKNSEPKQTDVLCDRNNFNYLIFSLPSIIVVLVLTLKNRVFLLQYLVSMSLLTFLIIFLLHSFVDLSRDRLSSLLRAFKFFLVVVPVIGSLMIFADHYFNFGKQFWISFDYFVRVKTLEMLSFDFHAREFSYDFINNVLVFEKITKFSPSNMIAIFIYILSLMSCFSFGFRLIAAMGIFVLIAGINILRNVLTSYESTLSLIPWISNLTLLGALVIWGVLVLLRFNFCKEYLISQAEPYLRLHKFEPAKTSNSLI